MGGTVGTLIGFPLLFMGGMAMAVGSTKAKVCRDNCGNHIDDCKWVSKWLSIGAAIAFGVGFIGFFLAMLIPMGMGAMISALSFGATLIMLGILVAMAATKINKCKHGCGETPACDATCTDDKDSKCHWVRKWMIILSVVFFIGGPIVGFLGILL